MPKIDVTALTEAQATLLMPLWARAQESHHPAALLHDEKAVSTVADLDFPFHRFEAKALLSSLSHRQVDLGTLC